MEVKKTIKLFIGGAFPRTESGITFPEYTVDNLFYANICKSTRKDLRNTVEVANKAQAGWEKNTAYLKGQIIYRMAEMLEHRQDELKEILVKVQGYSIGEAEEEIDKSISNLIYYAGFSDKFQALLGTVNPVASSFMNYTQVEAVGTVALLTCEEFSLAKLIGDIASIIVGGNTVIAILSGKGQSILACLGEIFQNSDLPAGVVNLLSSEKNDLVSHVATHMDIQSVSCQLRDKASLSLIKKEAARSMKRVVGPSDKDVSLEAISQFLEFKTVWHPLGH